MRRITCLVLPGLKVHCLGWADTEEDSQDFRTAYSLSKRWIQAGAALLDKPEVKSCRVSDRLKVVARGQVGIGSRNCRKLPAKQSWDRLGKREVGIQVRVIDRAAIPSPVTGIHGELHEVCKPSDLLCPCRLTTRQSTKLIEVDWIGPLRNQIRVDESEVGHLILGIVMDVLGNVRIENRKGRGVGWTPSSSWDFAVLNSSEFVVLLPQISLEDFGCS
jgi:hypothetical protein